MKNEVKFSETVMLVDAAFLNFVMTDIKKNFERMLGRLLQEVDLSDLFVYLALDAGLAPGKNEVQVLLIYDADSTKFSHCHPSDLAEELSGTAFQDASMGEFSFYSFQPEGMVSLEELYLESLALLTEAKEVKKLVVISFNEEYGDKVAAILDKAEDKEIVQFRMNEPGKQTGYRWEILAYPLMRALGIRGEEL